MNKSLATFFTRNPHKLLKQISTEIYYSASMGKRMAVYYVYDLDLISLQNLVTKLKKRGFDVTFADTITNEHEVKITIKW